jgi:UDP-N-acetylglucosamine 4,6-dehydratase
MEKVLQAAARRLVDATTILSSVRYGNVMYSRGSVIPLFIQQIRGGRPITVTVPEMTRFLLPLPQAIELVAFALRHAGQGDLMVRKAPACTIEVLADALKQLFKSDTPINVIGIRHGEKLYETLATREELGKAQDMGDYYRIVMDDRDLNYGRYISQGDAREAQLGDYTSHNTQRLNREEVVEMLLSLPEVRLELAEAGCL